MWLFFVLVIIITCKIPICSEGPCEFVGFGELLKSNIIPLLSLIGIAIGAISYFDFNYKLGDATHMPFNIVKIQSIDYEHLTFLTTYIVPLVCFNFLSMRYQIVLLILLVVIGIIYIRTDLFYANPTLALLKYRIYRVDGQFEDGLREEIILIARRKLNKNQRCDYLKLDDRIYYAKPK